MAERIYDQTVGQLAGVKVVTTGKGIIKRDGTDAFAQGVVLLDTNGGTVGGSEYETVAALQTAQVLGATGATGDYLTSILVVPATTSPGAVTVTDGSTGITVFTGGASSVADLKPFSVPLGIASVSGAWKVTTGASVSVIGIGNFT